MVCTRYSIRVNATKWDGRRLNNSIARRRYYSADQMTLAVLGKETLSQLQRTVDDLFKAVPNRGSGSRPSERWLGKVKPFMNNQPLQAFNIVPVQVGLCCFCFGYV